MPQTHEGVCQCGAVRYRITGEATALVACHCSHCQRQSGSAFGLSMRLAADQFELIKGELKGFARPGNDRIITGSFCPHCGTHIHHKLSDQPDVISLKLGTLDDTEWLIRCQMMQRFIGKRRGNRHDHIPAPALRRRLSMRLHPLPDHL